MTIGNTVNKPVPKAAALHLAHSSGNFFCHICEMKKFYSPLWVAWSFHHVTKNTNGLIPLAQQRVRTHVTYTACCTIKPRKNSQQHKKTVSVTILFLFYLLVLVKQKSKITQGHLWKTVVVSQQK